MMVMVFGTLIGFTGSAIVSLLMATALHGFFVVASNAKYKMLGEPLVFSDLALIGAVFKHPQFYLSAVQMWQKCAIAGVAGALIVALYHSYDSSHLDHLLGLVVLGIGFVGLAISLKLPFVTARAVCPKLEDDVSALGLLPTLMLYWLRWRAIAHPAAWTDQTRAVQADAPMLVVAIQCESFADPEEIFADLTENQSSHLRGLASARANAYQWGNLEVSGFGAYTMRTEYGVIFGRTEEELAFRRFDPLLTAEGEGSYALPQKLKNHGSAAWNSAFLHPHDMRFYGRNTIMPAAGFDTLLGEAAFAPPMPDDGRYVTDAAIADTILQRAATTLGPDFLYAVTIENHGPWSSSSGCDLVDAYLKLTQHSDAMLARLQAELPVIAAAKGQASMLIFFGDHRPSIPGATSPQAERHTPYVILRFDSAGQLVKGTAQRQDVTPAALHHAILDQILGKPLPL